MPNLPQLELQPNGLFKLTSPYRSEFNYDEKEKTLEYVIVPQQVCTNFGSIPWYVRWIISPIDPTLCRGALTHDYLVNELTRSVVVVYKAHWLSDRTQLVEDGVRSDDVDWKQAAAILRLIMLEDGASLWKRQVVYLGVRLHGLFRI